MTPLFRAFLPADATAVSQLMQQLSVEDAGGKPVTPEKAERTFSALTEHPDFGQITVVEIDGTVVGYAILINFWSNEFGGNMLTIDELYIAPDFRGQGIGTQFIQQIIVTHPSAVAFQLEVSPENKRANELYQRLGFVSQRNSVLVLEK
jgi:ribosomal protein S18 acetylase RimI-like enzyme